jgi:hypothetical protein
MKLLLGVIVGASAMLLLYPAIDNERVRVQRIFDGPDDCEQGPAYPMGRVRRGLDLPTLPVLEVSTF